MKPIAAPALNTRLDYLDAVRAFALLLGIVFHASLSFMPIFIGWAVMDVSTSPFVASFMHVSHSFRMELFFLIAGFFSHMTFHRKGSGSFMKSRFTRIAIPFVAGWFLLKPLIVSGWVMGSESMRGEVDILNGLKIGFLSLGELPTGLLVGSHLWFLYYLLLVTGAALAMRAIVGRSERAYAVLTRWSDAVVSWVARSRFSWWALAVPTGACLWFMSNWGVDTPDKSLAPHWPALALYGGFFGFGWVLHRQAALIESFARVTCARVALCVASVWVSLALSGYQADMGHPQLDLIRAGHALSYSLMMWSLVALSIGVFKRLFDRPSKVVRYIADGSYWLYLVHLPIVIWLQIVFAELPFHWALKLAGISILTVVISLAIYELVVRSTWIGALLNGRRRERWLKF